MLPIWTVASWAGNLTWTLVGVTFGDGGTASGSFVYNADTDEYSSIAVTTTTGSVRSGASYSFVSRGFFNGATAVAFTTGDTGDLTGTPAFAIFPASAFTNSGGGTNIDFGKEGACGDAACDIIVSPRRLVSAGSIVSDEVVPEPSSSLLLGFGVMTLGVARKRLHTR